VKTDNGNPLVYEREFGAGRFVFVNAREYAGNEALSDMWISLIKEQLKKIVEEEPCWVSCGEDVEFTVYDHEDGSRVFYVLAVDWYRDPETIHSLKLRIGKDEYLIHMKFGVMLKILVKDDVAIWADTEDVEIRLTDKESVEIITLADSEIHIARKGKISDVSVNGTYNVIQL